MTRETFRPLRFVGLAIEAGFVVALCAYGRQKEPITLLGRLDLGYLLIAGLAFGFVVWLVGMAATEWPRGSRER
jgi:hypothetical protein